LTCFDLDTGLEQIENPLGPKVLPVEPVHSVTCVSGPDTFVFGGADGIRTHDLLDAIEARSQLRHGPTGSM
jgi:hypothetical protein